jgi:hypothetical protein
MKDTKLFRGPSFITPRPAERGKAMLRERGEALVVEAKPREA